MDFNVEVRKKQLESLDQYISSSKDKLQSILDCLGWKTEKVLENDTRILCPVNPSHRIHPSSAEKHVDKCCIKVEGYDLNEQFLSEPTDTYPGRSIKIDQYNKIQILSRARYENPYFRAAWNGHDPDPKTSNRILSTFSPDERLVLYDYCRANTVGPKTPPAFDLFIQEKNENHEFTDIELKQMERDLKRRQVKYKSVHTNHKTHTEIMKEVIEQQILLYEEWITKKSQNNKTDLPSNSKQSSNFENETNNSEIDPDQSPTNDLDCSNSIASKYSNSSRATNSKKEYEYNPDQSVNDLDCSNSIVSKYSNSSRATNSKKEYEYKRNNSDSNNFKYTRVDYSPSNISKYSESSSRNSRRRYKEHHEQHYDRNSNERTYERSYKRRDESSYKYKDYKHSRSPNSRHSSVDSRSTNYLEGGSKSRHKRNSRSKERYETRYRHMDTEIEYEQHHKKRGGCPSDDEDNNYRSNGKKYTNDKSKYKEDRHSSRKHRDKYEDYEYYSNKHHHKIKDHTKSYKM